MIVLASGKGEGDAQVRIRSTQDNAIGLITTDEDGSVVAG
jgi:hypothetical protein